MKHKHLSSIIKGLLLALSSSFLLVGTVFASPYGSGNYGACQYQVGCPAGSSSSSSSSSQTSQSAATEPGSVLLNDFPEYFTDGKQLDVVVGQIIYFDVDNNGVIERHKLIVKEIGADYVIVTVDDSTVEVRFSVGDSKQFDVTKDSQNDIDIKLNSITDKKANFTFKQLGKAVRTPASTITPAVSSAKKSRNWWWPALSIFALLLGSSWFLLLWRRRRRDNSDYTPPTFTPTTGSV